VGLDWWWPRGTRRSLGSAATAGAGAVRAAGDAEGDHRGGERQGRDGYGEYQRRTERQQQQEPRAGNSSRSGCEACGAPGGMVSRRRPSAALPWVSHRHLLLLDVLFERARSTEVGPLGGENVGRSTSPRSRNSTEEELMGRPTRIWWARPRKLCALERPGGGGRSHRPDRREAEIEYLQASGVRLVVSTMVTRHNLDAYEEAGLEWHHVPVESCGAASAEEQLEELLAFLRRELRRRGAVAVHGNRHTDFVAALCAAHLKEARGLEPEAGLAAAGEAGLMVTPEAAALVGADYEAVQPRSRIAAATSPGLSVTT
jgi:hypothetical protein